MNYELNYVFRHFSFRLRVVGGKAIMSVDDGHFVCIDAEACAFVLKAVQDDEVEVLALHLVLSILEFVVRLESKAHEDLLLFLDSTKGCGYVLRRLQLELQVVALPLYLFVGCRLGREVRNSCTKDGDVGLKPCTKLC